MVAVGGLLQAMAEGGTGRAQRGDGIAHGIAAGLQGLDLEELAGGAPRLRLEFGQLVLLQAEQRFLGHAAAGEAEGEAAEAGARCIAEVEDQAARLHRNLVLGGGSEDHPQAKGAAPIGRYVHPLDGTVEAEAAARTVSTDGDEEVALDRLHLQQREAEIGRIHGVFQGFEGNGQVGRPRQRRKCQHPVHEDLQRSHAIPLCQIGLI